MSDILNNMEFYLWKKKKCFNKLGFKGKTEINTKIFINTSMDNKEINFSSVLLKTVLTKKNEINFG